MNGTAARADGRIDGLRPTDIAQAYKLTGGTTGTVGIVDAYDNPNAEADLAVYRKQWGLPACTTRNGCFRKVNQDGQTSPLPTPDTSWAVEISLDLDAVSAACPRCKMVLVEATSPTFAALAASVNTAVAAGADVVSNSYGGDEFNGMNKLSSAYNHSGVPMVVSSGDFGFKAAQFPAVLRTSIAVGGTRLTPATNARGWTEQAWSGAGSGCSAYISKPAWQRDEHCPGRTVADVSAVADPVSGLAVYDSFGYQQFSDSPWFTVGGTSLASPLVAGMITRAGHATRYNNAAPLYARAAAFNDVVGGSTGYCGNDYLCTGKPGYDAPTGVGTPSGLGAL